MTRRAVALLIPLVLCLPARAGAQFQHAGDPSTVGMLHPGTTLTLSPDARSLDVNPAQLGYLQSWNIVLAHTELRNKKGRFLGTGTGLFLASPVPLLPMRLGFSAQYLRRPEGFGTLYPDVAKLSLGGAMRVTRWLTLGMAGHLFVAPGNEVMNTLLTLDLALTIKPFRWLAVGAAVRDLSTQTWAGLPLQRLWDIEIGIRPLVSGRLALTAGLRVGGRRRDITPHFSIQGEPWPGLTLFAEATWSQRDLNALDGVEREQHDVRFTAGLRVDFGHVGFGAAFVGGAWSRPGGVPSGGATWVRVSGSRYRSVNRHRDRVLLLEIPKRYTTRSHYRLLAALHRAARDRGTKAVILKITPVSGWGVAEELRQALFALRRSGRKVVAYVHAAGSTSYYVALAADRIVLFPGGGLRVAGLKRTGLYFKGTLDRLGIKAQIIKHAEYKSAPEAFTRKGPSPEAARMRDDVLDHFSLQLYRALARRPKIRSVARARALLDKGPFTAAEALRHGLVDQLSYADKLPRWLAKYLGRYYRIERPPKAPARDDAWGILPTVAVIAVEGDIVEGRSRTLPILDRRTVGAKSVVKLLARAAAAPNVKAIVLRIESGGGSALASEVIWRAVTRVAKVKPVFASLGNVAASGGYFIAAGAKKIFAQPLTITGSIGIFSGKADLSGLLRKLGVSVHVAKRGLRADVDSLYRPYTASERAVLKRKLRYYYHRFLDAVAKGRKKLKTRARVDQVARGRVWTGVQARRRHLVDRTGGLWQTVQAVRRKVGLRVGDGHRVVVLPRPRPSLLKRALKLILPLLQSKRSPLLNKVLAPLRVIPPAFLLSRASTPLARMPVDFTIR